MAVVKVIQKLTIDQFKQISSQVKAGQLHVLIDNTGTTADKKKVIGRVSEAFHLGKKVEITTDIGITAIQAELKFVKLEEVWYLNAVTKKA